MTAISITPGYPTFADTDGSPLNDGYVYIGLEYQDPITAPTTAFWDKDFRIPADQPLRTSGGYVVRDGSPAAVYTGAAYSILVQNKNLVTVYNAPSAVITNVTNDVEIITQYQGAHATDPIARNDGTPLQTGDLYFNTVVNELKVWTGTVWVPAVPGTVTVENFTGTGAQTAFNLATAPVAENNTQIYIDGVYQQKDTYTLSGATINFSAAPPNLSTIEVVTFSISSLGTTDASNVSYNEGGTGAVNRSVQDKLQESVSVLDFGAASGSDITTAFLAAAKYCSANLRRMFIPYGIYTISGGIDGVADSVSYLEMEFETDATIRFDDSGGGFDWLKDISTLIIRGGYIGASGYEISGDYGTIRYTQNAAELWLEDVDFNGGSLQQHCVFSATDIGPTKLTVTKCDFRNFLHEAFELYAETSGTSESQYIIQDSYFKNMGTLLQAITVRAILLGSNDSRLDNVVVKNCKIDGVYCGNGPANGILLYGNSVVVDGNYVKDVINTLGDDAEGIYVKATNARIVNNYVLNGGNSHDGSINIKGSSVVGSDEEAGYSIIANNCVELTNTTIDVPGITVNRSHVICTNNVLTDLRANRGTKTIGTALGIGTSEPVADVIVSNNIITGFKNYFGSLTNYPAQIAHNGLIADNICTLADSGYVMPFRDDAAILSFGPSNGQRVEGGADGNFVNLEVTGSALIGTTTANITYAPRLYTESALGDGNGGILIGSYKPSATFLDFSGGTPAVHRIANDGGNLYFETDTNQDGTFDTVGAHFTSIGNLAFASGKGIDFSATAGTGTSELFDDYEEGVFTATLTPATSGTITLASTGNELAYTKVGRQVFINGLLIVDSVSSPVGGSVKLNLPFTTANLGDGAGRSAGASVQNTSGAYLLTPMYSFEGVVEAEIIFDASTVTAAHRFYISLSYITA
jgi:hypothetical protein